MATQFERATQTPKRYRMWVEIGEAPDSEWFTIPQTLLAAEVDAAYMLVIRALAADPNKVVLQSLQQKLAALRVELRE